MKIANVGNDIAKRWFDLCVIMGEKQIERRFPNNSSGCSECMVWLASLGADIFNVVLEPTGRYSELIADYLFKQERVAVYQVHPFRFNKFRESLDFRVGTDAKSAWALAVYAEERIGKDSKYPPKLYEPKTEIQKELRDIRVRLRSLYKRKSNLEGHLEAGLVSETIKTDTACELKQIEQRIESILEFAKTVIAGNAQLSRDIALIDSITGIGWKTALALVCLIDFRKFKTSRDLACFLGLSTRKKESGSSIHSKGRITKAGDKWVRAALYFPAMTAIQHNPQLRAFSDRLTSRGKIYPVIRTAVGRKLVTIAWALIKNDTFYNTEVSEPT